jgi:hypothetical protein
LVTKIGSTPLAGDPFLQQQLALAALLLTLLLEAAAVVWLAAGRILRC